MLRHGYHPNALYWSNKEIQELRFRVLADIGIQSGDSVLDVGCGFGDLFGYLNKQGVHVEYTGVDLSPELIDEGEKQYPQASFLVGDLFDLNPEAQSFDYVVLSGALNEQLNDDGVYARKVIARMFEYCRKGVAFNLLDARNEWIASCTDLQSFNPDEVSSFSESFTGKPKVREDYLDNDFTVYLHRDR